MKKLGILVIVFLFSIPCFADNWILSIGFDNFMGYRWANSHKVTAYDTDITKYVKFTEENGLVAPGFTIYLRRFTENNKANFWKINCLFPAVIDTTLTADVSDRSASVNFSNVSNDWNAAFILEVGSGISLPLAIRNTSRFLFDFGAEINLFIFDAGTNTYYVREAAFNFGPTLGFAFQADVSKHWCFEAGIGMNILIGLGRRTESFLGIDSFNLGLSGNPYLAIGYKF